MIWFLSTSLYDFIHEMLRMWVQALWDLVLHRLFSISNYGSVNLWFEFHHARSIELNCISRTQTLVSFSCSLATESLLIHSMSIFHKNGKKSEMWQMNMKSPWIISPKWFLGPSWLLVCNYGNGKDLSRHKRGKRAL